MEVSSSVSSAYDSSSDDLSDWSSVLWSESVEVFLASSTNSNLLVEASSKLSDGWSVEVGLDDLLNSLSISEFLGVELGWLLLVLSLEISDSSGEVVDVSSTVGNGVLLSVVSFKAGSSGGLGSLKVSLSKSITLLDVLSVDLSVSVASSESSDSWNSEEVLSVSILSLKNSIVDLSDSSDNADSSSDVSYRSSSPESSDNSPGSSGVLISLLVDLVSLVRSVQSPVSSVIGSASVVVSYTTLDNSVSEDSSGDDDSSGLWNSL